MANDEGFTRELAESLEKIGVLRNNWRKRLVHVYAHPTDPEKVVSVGYPMECPPVPIVCVEKRVDYQRTIDLFPQTAVYDQKGGRMDAIESGLITNIRTEEVEVRLTLRFPSMRHVIEFDAALHSWRADRKSKRHEAFVAALEKVTRQLSGVVKADVERLEAFEILGKEEVDDA